MGREVVLFKSEEQKDLPAVAAFLRELANKLDQNRVILRRGEEEIVLNIPHNVVLELKVEEEERQKRPKRTLEVEIEWIEGDELGGAVTLG